MHTFSDISLKNRYIEEYWKIVDNDKEWIREEEIFHENWEINSPKAAKVIILLDHIKFVNKNILTTTKGEIKIAIDNSMLCKD